MMNKSDSFKGSLKIQSSSISEHNSENENKEIKEKEEE